MAMTPPWWAPWTLTAVATYICVRLFQGISTGELSRGSYGDVFRETAPIAYWLLLGEKLAFASGLLCIAWRPHLVTTAAFLYVGGTCLLADATIDIQLGWARFQWFRLFNVILHSDDESSGAF